MTEKEGANGGPEVILANQKPWDKGRAGGSQ